jgi:hypothetical protein
VKSRFSLAKNIFENCLPPTATWLTHCFQIRETSTTPEPMTMKSMNKRLFSLAIVALMATSSGAFAKKIVFNAAEKAINTHMPTPGTDISTAVADDVFTATKATIDDPSVKTNIKTSALVAAGVKWAPKLSPEIAQAGLLNISGDVTLHTGDRKTQAGAIVKAALKAAVLGSPKIEAGSAVLDTTDRAAAVTAISVSAVKDSQFDYLLTAVVTSAIKTANTLPAKNPLPNLQHKAVIPSNGFSSSKAAGVAGATTGAIAEVAGVSNANIADNASTNDSLTLTVITTAVKAAKSRVSDIAEAVGYAFAGTYRFTTDDGSEDSVATFTSNNLTALQTAVLAGLPKSQRGHKASSVNAQIIAGINLAYNNQEGPGEQGINDFAYNNATGTPVTDVTGL